MAHRRRLLTHEVTLDAPAELTARLAAPVECAAVPLLCRTGYEVRTADGAVDLIEDGALFAVLPSLDDAVPPLEDRIRRRVFDLAAHHDWLPLNAGLLVRGDDTWLVVGGEGEFALVRSGSALAYPRLFGPADDPVVVGPRPVTRIVLRADAAGKPPASVLTAALLAARIDTGVRRPGADVAEIAALIRQAGG